MFLRKGRRKVPPAKGHLDREVLHLVQTLLQLLRHQLVARDQSFAFLFNFFPVPLLVFDLLPVLLLVKVTPVLLFLLRLSLAHLLVQGAGRRVREIFVSETPREQLASRSLSCRALLLQLFSHQKLLVQILLLLLYMLHFVGHFEVL